MRGHFRVCCPVLAGDTEDESLKSLPMCSVDTAIVPTLLRKEKSRKPMAPRLRAELPTNDVTGTSWFLESKLPTR